MRSTSLAVLLLSCAAAAQNNPFMVFPQDPQRQGITCASFVRRPSNNNQAAEGLLEVSSAYFRGVGDLGGACFVNGFYHWAADENVATAETYDIVIRAESTAGGPDTSPTGLLLSVPGLGLPVGAGGPRGSWIITDVFATPFLVPCSSTWFMGISFPANPAWPATDGHSLWAADTTATSTALVGENPRPGAPSVHWSSTPGGAAFPRGWSVIMGPLVPAPVLHVGGNDPLSTRQGTTGGPNIGLGGLFPDVSGSPRADGLELRVQDSINPSGIAVLAASFGFGPVSIPFAGFTGQLHLDISTLVTIGFVQLSGGAGNLVVAPPGSISPAFLGASVQFQGLVVNPATNTGAFTNAQSSLL